MAKHSLKWPAMFPNRRSSLRWPSFLSNKRINVTTIPQLPSKPSWTRRHAVVDKEAMDTDLHDAIASGNINRVSHLLILPETDPTQPGYDGKTPLHVAIEYGHIGIVKLLLRLPEVCPYEVLDDLQRTPLHVACWKGYGAIVEILLATRPKEDVVFDVPVGAMIEPEFDSEAPESSSVENEDEIVNVFNFDMPLRVRMPGSFMLIGQRLFGTSSSPVSEPVVEEVKHSIAPPPTPRQRLPYVDVNAKARGKLVEEAPRRWTTSGVITQQKEEWLARGFTPLHLAAWKGSEECVKLLLAEPEIDLNAKTFERFTALHMAAERGHEEVVHLILQEQARREPERQMAHDINLVNDRDMKNMNHERDQRMLKFQYPEKAIKGNGPINAIDCVGRTPLHYAARQGRALTVKELLLWNDTFVNVADNCGLLPMHMAAREGHATVVELLLYEYHWGPTVLKSHKQPTMVTQDVTLQYFPVAGDESLELLPRPDLSDVSIVVTAGSTPLHMAAIKGHIQAVLKLLKYVDPTVQNGDQQTALDLVVQALQGNKWQDSYRLIDMFKLLLVCMPKVNIISECEIRFWETLKLDTNAGRESLLWKLDAFHASTLLHWAASKGSAYLVQLLLKQAGVDINSIGEFEKFTPLHLAAKAGHTEVVRLLTAEEKLRANEEDWLGRTALQIAADRNEMSKHRSNKKKMLVANKNPLEGIVEMSWRDVEQLLLNRDDVKGYVDLLYRDRQVFVDAANAILVGSALIATITYMGWTQPPLGYVTYYHPQWELPHPAPPGTFPSYAAIEQYTTVRAFWIFNSMSFFFSMASVIASAEGILPVQGKFIKEAVQDARKAVVYASLLLVLSVVFALGSFASCGFAVLPPIERWEKYMVATISFGGLTTIVFTARFVLPISKMLKHQQNPLNQVPRGKFQKLEW